MLQKLNKKLSRNQKGFSLIELMIAVAILALAAFGIFQAFTTGFMGMAESRERTVATNYLREAMENVKNIDFDKITTTTRRITDGNKEYQIDVNIIEETSTFKKIYTIVSWKDREGATKTVNASLTINFTEVFASDAAKIVLFTESYNILNDTSSPYSSTEVIAVIKDISGNTITDWDDGNISFENTSTEIYGSLSDTTVPPVEGKASTNFSSDGTFSAGEAPTDNYYILQNIKASVTIPDVGEVTDTITIKITDGPVKIILDANPISIKAGTGNYSTITASIENAAGDILKKKDIFNDIDITFNIFSINEGVGTFEPGLNTTTYSATIHFDSGSEENATVTIDLYSTDNQHPGVVNIVATSPNLESDSADVIFLGSPVKISITANPNSIYLDDVDGSIITVTLLDSNGYPTSPIDNPINVSLSFTENKTGGDIEDSSLYFDISDEAVSKTTIFSGQISAGIAIIKGIPTGLTGEDDEVTDEVTIYVLSPLIPNYIKLEANPKNVKADGIENSNITAVIYDDSGKIVTTYNETITFTVNFPNDSVSDIEMVANGGIADTVISSTTSGTAIISATSMYGDTELSSEENAEVIFYGIPHHVELEANPVNVKTGGIEYSTITAKILDVNDNIVNTDDYNIAFLISSGVGYFDSENYVYTSDGIASIKLASKVDGSSFVTADSSPDLIGSALEVEIVFYTETTLTLVGGTLQYEDVENKELSFDVRVTGENITVNTMKIIWTDSPPKAKLNSIAIMNEAEEEISIYSGNTDSSITVDIVETTLTTDIDWTMKLSFSKNMTANFPIYVYFNSGPDQYYITLNSSP